MLAKKLMGATAAKKPLYVDDVFSTYLYTGNGSTQTINNGIDLAGEGGLVWTKIRTASYGHYFVDTVRGVNQSIQSDTTTAQVFTPNGLNTFNSDGYSLGANAGYNFSGDPFVSWTFRRAPKFFDIVTYTGDGTSNRQITHALGAEPGFITTKSTNTTGNWYVYHRSATGDLVLNSTAVQTGSRAIITAADSSTFTVSGVANTNGVTYVAYLWAHDDSEDGIIQCGSYIGNGSATGPVVNLGWEPQYLMIKNASGTGNWQIIDTMRGMVVGGVDAALQANLSNAESSVDYISPTATGFQVTSASSEVNTSGSTYIYMAIRRPNKPPKSGTEVYNAIAVTQSTGTYNDVGFPIDLQITAMRSVGVSRFVSDRLRGVSTVNTGADTPTLRADANYAEYFPTQATHGWDNSGFRQPGHTGGSANIHWSFRRAPGFFDVVCDTGTGAAHAIAHNLTVAPELVIRKSRSAATQWEVWHSALAATEKLVLNSNAAKVTDATAWNSTAPGASSFTVGTGANVNASGATFVTYMWATLAGVSKVGQYTGNGSTQTIDCGFTTGARFILIKRTDAAGDWYVWDSARGIVAANDPHLSLNTTAAEVTTDDSVDPAPEGFIVNQVAATNINVSGGQYIFLAIS